MKKIEVNGKWRWIDSVEQLADKLNEIIDWINKHEEQA